LEVSVSNVVEPPPELAQRRLASLGYNREVLRTDVERVCGTESAANQFIDTARKRGWLVPTAWGKYRVPSRRTVFELVSRIPHPTFALFAAWASTIRTVGPRKVAFAAPRLWRETSLSIDDPLPVVLLEPLDQDEHATPPQWDAFQMDAASEPWELRAGGFSTRFEALALRDLIDLLRASRDPRFVLAARELEAKHGARSVAFDPRPRLDVPEPASRGNRTRKIGLGPPFRRRLLAPPWYMNALRASLNPVHGSDAP
jgi:hypothetical protein